MPLTLMELPYAADALAPVISPDTLTVHHGKHHKAYVDKTNALAAEAGLADADLEVIIRTAAKDDHAKLFNQAAQVWNHGFYWMSLSPKPSAPGAELAERIKADFGSHDDFVEQFTTAATDHFGSGWAWLNAGTTGKLKIETTHDADCPVTGRSVPLLTVDVWEHAYYLDRKNDRKAYVQAVVAERLNWDFASENFARGAIWTYPG